ncbi:lipase 2 [Elasticomyces elasticus]|nr:lipase 2 [Elasticomyces elasticus]KAK3635169.1 lipase 2 [Elasticomyces elasticus]KAK4911522.1 lipase 2 [Elasticomyces elasticus]KAK5751055.1 lipase 2 [Elasticomyces elasticus]
MKLPIHRTALRRRNFCLLTGRSNHAALFHATAFRPEQSTNDPRLKDIENLIEDQFAVLRPVYKAPKNPIILAHGLLGFDEWHIAGQKLPGIHYWRGITESLAEKGVEVITATVPPSGSIEARAAQLADSIERKAKGKAVNIIAGLDSRYMISRLQPPNVKVLSLTTIATPHRGSAFADYLFRWIGTTNLPHLYKTLNYFGLETGAFEQLTMKYMAESFNPRTPDVEGIEYYSYGATLRPRLTSVFRKSHNVVQAEEGPNDGLVSVRSAKWGTYKGTLDDVSHLDLINWTNKLRWWIWELTGHRKHFNAIAFYLDIAGGFTSPTMAKLKNPAKRYPGRRKLVHEYEARVEMAEEGYQARQVRRGVLLTRMAAAAAVHQEEIDELEEEIIGLEIRLSLLCDFPVTDKQCICEHKKSIAGLSIAEDTPHAEEAGTESNGASVLGTVVEEQRGELQGSTGVSKSDENASLAAEESRTVDDGAPSAVSEDASGYFGHRNIGDSRQEYGAFSGYGDNDEDMSSESWSHVSSVASLDFEEEAEFVELPSDEEVDTELAV